jgi:hypothetical protein
MDAIHDISQNFVTSVLLVVLGGWALIAFIGGKWKHVCLAVGGFLICATFVFMPRSTFKQIGDNGAAALQSITQQVGDAFQKEAK